MPSGGGPRTGKRKPGLQATQRVSSSDIPPPGTIMWRCGWWVIAEPQLWSMAVKPMRAPRCFGSAAIVSSVSAAAPWHLGQCRLRHELYEIRLWPQSWQRSTWPPRAAERGGGVDGAVELTGRERLERSRCASSRQSRAPSCPRSCAPAARLPAGGKKGRSSGAPLSSWRLLDLQCSGSDAPIVTPYRSSTHCNRPNCTGHDAALPRERVRS
jgi:hypothetical protein